MDIENKKWFFQDAYRNCGRTSRQRVDVMYYMAKSLQLLGIFSIPIGVIVKYPKLMDPKLFLASLIIFGSGMAIEKYLLK